MIRSIRSRKVEIF